MMPEHRPDGKIKLEDLLRVKRAERPAAEFWTQFERELHTRQLAAAVEKRRWWYALPRVLSGVARYQMPVGAAAVLAVTFLTLREYREPGFEREPVAPRATAPSAPVAVDTPRAEPAAEPVGYAAMPVEPSPQEVAVVHREAGTRALSPMVPWSAGVPEEPVEQPLSPSARSIAANLAAAEPELAGMLGRGNSLRVNEATAREPLAQLSSPRDLRRERLFAYDAELARYGFESEQPPGSERVASRLNDTELYDSVRRLSGAGDRLTVRF